MTAGALISDGVEDCAAAEGERRVLTVSATEPAAEVVEGKSLPDGVAWDTIMDRPVLPPSSESMSSPRSRSVEESPLNMRSAALASASSIVLTVLTILAPPGLPDLDCRSFQASRFAWAFALRSFISASFSDLEA